MVSNRAGTILFVCAMLLLAAGIALQLRLRGPGAPPAVFAAERREPEAAAASGGAEAGAAGTCTCPVFPAAAGPLVDLNRATAEELARLPGIGPAFAQRIIALREQRGGFRYKEELLDVPGIGPVRYEQLAPLVTVGPYGVDELADGAAP